MTSPDREAASRLKAPESPKFINARAARYQPNVVHYLPGDGGRWKADVKGHNTAVFLANIPVGEEAEIFTPRGRLTAKILEVRETPQKGNQVVVVQTDSENRGFQTRALAAGTAAIRLTHRVPVEFRDSYRGGFD